MSARALATATATPRASGVGLKKTSTRIIMRHRCLRVGGIQYLPTGSVLIRIGKEEGGRQVGDRWVVMCIPDAGDSAEGMRVRGVRDWGVWVWDGFNTVGMGIEEPRVNTSGGGSANEPREPRGLRAGRDGGEGSREESSRYERGRLLQHENRKWKWQKIVIRVNAGMESEARWSARRQDGRWQ
ncbi:hypothetical protein B0H13DRAFT_2265279 [Mycena leptocephala]|nr:hypothetical protein B0H13DRAFT_2265279 [Mycena leptocephala]